MSVLATIEPAELKVEPGSEASLVVRVRNRGTVVERFDIAVVGPTAPWATIDQPALRLFPDKEGEARITFRPPRASDPAADTYPFGVSVRAASDANASTVEEGRIAVAPFVQLATEIVPQTSRGSRSGTHDVTVHNTGNAVAEVSVTASDPDRLLTFDVTPARAGLRPDARATVRTRVRPKETFLFGTPKRVPFSVQVDEPTAGSYQIPATLEQRAIIPGWVKPLAGLAVAGIAALLVLPGLLGLNAEDPGASGSQGAVLSPTPPPPTEPPVTQAPPTDGGGGATEAPTPTPDFGPPDTITAAGDGTGFETAMLSFKCPPEDVTCRDAVKARVLLMLAGFQGPARGAQLISFETAPIGTLPVTATWNDWHYPYRSEDGTVGNLERVSFDLAPLLVGGSAYALVDDISGTSFTFVVAAEDAKALFESLYNVAIVTPTPAPDPGSGGATLEGIYLRPIGDVLLRDFIFVPPTP